MNKAGLIALVAVAAGMEACGENSTAPHTESPDASNSVVGAGATQALTSHDTVKLSILASR